MMIQTERLVLMPLSVSQLKLWVEDLHKLEQKLGCTYDGESLDGEFGETVRGQMLIAEEDIGNYLFYSFWLIMRKKDRVIVGTAEFKGKPNENGEVEIAYGIGDKYFQHGYISETLEALCHWAKKQPTVRSIVIVGDNDNEKSQYVLSQCGFYKEKCEEGIQWRYV